MGVALTPISVKQVIELEQLRGKRLAIDGNGELYQFLALIRLPDGTPLRDTSGRVTSHLSGLFYRTTRLIADYGLEPVFVFDGVPPVLKSAELQRRRAIRERYEEEVVAARAAGDLPRAYSKATMTSRLTRDMLVTLEITREQLVDVAILVGNDFNPGIKGIGPKKALKLVREHGSIEHMPASIREMLEPVVTQVRRVFLQPAVTDEYQVETHAPDLQGVVRYLCGERAFSEERVTAALRRAFGI